jgi:hypothetical protein
MDTNKAAYWIALGVLTLGLSSEYRHGSFVALHRAAEHADVVLCRISARAERTLAVARILTGRGGFAADNLLASANGVEMARDRVELLREQARDEAEILRVRQRVGDGVRDSVREQIRAQAEVIRAQIDMHRIQVEQLRTAERSQVRMAHTVSRRVVICPKTTMRVVMSSPVNSDSNADKDNDSDNYSTE